MVKLFLLALLSLVAVASATSGGYNYHSSESRTVQHAHPAPQQHHQQASHDGGYEKQFYYFNAPEEQFHHSEAVKKIAPQKVKKNLQVIFIKPPAEKHHVKPVHNAVQHAGVEEKTHIYVLQKEPSHAAASKQVQHVQQAPVHHHKPEVHYVKYHTPAEAQHIQQTIIQQYGGKPSEIVHSGSAPVVSFVNSNHKNVQQHHTASESVNRQYLAPPEPATAASTVPANGYIPPV